MQGTQSAHLMTAEPTVFSQPWFDAFKDGCREVVDCSALLPEARPIKTDRRSSECDWPPNWPRPRRNMSGTMKTSEVGAMYEGHVHGNGVGYKGKVGMARAFTPVWSGPGIRTFTATSDAGRRRSSPERSGWLTIDQISEMFWRLVWGPPSRGNVPIELVD